MGRYLATSSPTAESSPERAARIRSSSVTVSYTHLHGWGGGGAVGAGVAVDRAGTVGLLQAVVVPALDGAGVALTFAGAADVHPVAGGEGVGLDDVADGKARCV